MSEIAKDRRTLRGGDPFGSFLLGEIVSPTSVLVSFEGVCDLRLPVQLPHEICPLLRSDVPSPDLVEDDPVLRSLTVGEIFVIYPV